MIDILGFKRLLILAVLLGFNVVLGGAVYLYMSPELVNKENQLRMLRSASSSVQADIDKIRIEFEQFEEQRVQFDSYKDDGFFVQQNRREIVDLLKAVQEKSGVVAAKVSVSPAVVEDNAEAEKAMHKILKSQVAVKLEALDDKDIFHYLSLINETFPGHISLESIIFKRNSEVNGTILRAVAGGRNFPLVVSDIVLVWRTMVPESQLILEGGER